MACSEKYGRRSLHESGVAMLRIELIACIAFMIIVLAVIASRETTARFNREQAQIINVPDCLVHGDSRDYILFLRCTKD
jgi:hypothetical protein